MTEPRPTNGSEAVPSTPNHTWKYKTCLSAPSLEPSLRVARINSAYDTLAPSA